MAAVLTNIGEEYQVDKMLETVQTKPEWLGWGTGAVAPSKASTDVSTPATEARVDCTCSKVGSGAAAVFQAMGVLTADGTKTITNVGLFLSAGTGSPPTGGSLILIANHTGIPLEAGDTVTYTFTIDPSQLVNLGGSVAVPDVPEGGFIFTLTCPNCATEGLQVAFGRRRDDTSVVAWRHARCPAYPVDRCDDYDYIITSLPTDGEGNLIPPS